MSTTRESGDLSVVAQVEEHVIRLNAVLSGGTPPPLACVKQALAATRALRGAASLAGLDTFQAFLARVFQLLESVDSGVLPWSGRVDSLLRDIAVVETYAAGRLERGESAIDDGDLEGFDAALASLHGVMAPVPGPATPPAPPSVPIAGTVSIAGALPPDVEAAVQQIQRWRESLESQALPVAARNVGIATLEREIAMLQDAIRTPHTLPATKPETPQEGLRNHCEGGLRNLVEAAAQEVLNEARERGVRLAMRVTGALDPVDDALGAALLELLAYLWSDALDAQANREAAEIDTVLRDAEDRLIVEIRDPAVAETGWSVAVSEDDVLGRYAGLRRSRPLVEALQGLVQVEPKSAVGCRFWLSLPRSTERPHATVVRVGRHEIAIPTSAIVGVHEAPAVHPGFDAAGAYVDVDAMRVPILHLAFALADVSYDELVREQVVVLGSFERRAAIFASQAHRSIVGRLTPEAQGLWAGTLETGSGVVPMLHVGALLGRCGPAEVVPATPRTAQVTPVPRGPLQVLVVSSAGAERELIAAAVVQAGHTARAVATAEEAWTVLAAGPVDVMVCDLRLPEMNAQQLAERRRMSGHFQQTPMLLVLAHPGEQSHLVVQQLGAAAWVRSPVDAAELAETVVRLVAV